MESSGDRKDTVNVQTHKNAKKVPIDDSDGEDVLEE